ncbi:hypothetical protein N180_03130 [Pedobacter antarcticus 4BY]|uniref:FecR protein domain-containing protein n=2 Tax=Pedobacter antarcticus TaxID=34086 RepID=A0A081PKN1_9SPHI|nr:FecR family protein [Pedobacter antarcticus]KEQ31254.1 hypothetical protein N180_03130 [Pedobacter antarcticus 4BY]SFE56527.1 FecR family protein [Pedobacter antarcticus]
MNDYRNYEAEDFLCDGFFIEWVLNPKPEHRVFWQTWLSENPDRREHVRKAVVIIRALQIKPNDKQLSDQDVADMSERFLHSITPKHSRLFKLSTRWTAAAAVLILVVGTILFKQNRQSPDILATTQSSLVKVYNDKQTPQLLQLADGSIVVLKSRSEITYPLKFSSTNREVFLKGEAFFEVRKDSLKAFLIHTGNMVTKVLGTSFTVSAYDGDNGFRVMVNTGKVEVSNNQKSADGSAKASVILTPNLQTVYQPKLSSFKTNPVSIPLILSPSLAKKEFSFTNAPLPVIIKKLEQAYGVTISYDKEKYEEVTVTASLSKLPLDEKVRAICKAIDAVYEFKDGTISIK